MDCTPGPECDNIQADFSGTIIGICLEWLLYGKIIANEVQLLLILFTGLLGLYSGIFAIYIKCHWDKSDTKKGTIIFYALCLLYVLSTATIVCDIVIIIIEVSNNFYYL
jgi:hypothetical protein